MEKIRIVLVEDHHLFRQSLAALLRTLYELDLVYEARQASDFLEYIAVTEQLPDVVLLDVQMPGMNGLELSELLHRYYPGIKVIALSAYPRESVIARMIDAGACAFLNKTCDADELLKAITTVHHTGVYLGPEVLAAMRSASRHRRGDLRNSNNIHVDLTRREVEILELLCRECSTTEIAERLYISIRTVEGHRNNLLLKTGCRNMVGLVLFALRNDIFELSI